MLRNKLISQKESKKVMEEKLKEQENVLSKEKDFVLSLESKYRGMKLMFLSWISAFNRILHLNVEVSSFEDFDPEKALKHVENQLKSFMALQSTKVIELQKQLKEQEGNLNLLQVEKCNGVWENNPESAQLEHELTKLRLEISQLKGRNADLKDTLKLSEQQQEKFSKKASVLAEENHKLKLFKDREALSSSFMSLTEEKPKQPKERDFCSSLKLETLPMKKSVKRRKGRESSALTELKSILEDTKRKTGLVNMNERGTEVKVKSPGARPVRINFNKNRN